MTAIDGEAAGRSVLTDTNGGQDWINAAAVSSDVSLSLVSGQRTTFGGQTAFTISRESTIENAVTGDGNDTLIGNRFDNRLYGMRGNDVLNGGAGNDILFGGAGNDQFRFDTAGVSGKDTILDWSAGDLIASTKALRGAGADGKVTVAANATLLLDGTSAGDTVLLKDDAGAVLQAMGAKNGYYWYAYVSGTDATTSSVIHEASGSPASTAAGAGALTAQFTGDAHDGVSALTATAGSAGHADQNMAFFLYDAMAGSMAGGVQLYA
ncbi:M10 family metallopeptidase C-terminal domain-containing protein [Sphingomonas sp. A2-49]|uniref:calcium-binding protein n=1 Tax=Sphingomonas sp. A2-49 TaxID=1391375 RepID=UPI0021CEE4D9|nr:M10 family metallopeptidase C-terminal domain-containing protein [Sphingomonas sp. A2-49]MCU6453896.1 M10 family metallopeptidase C-terminal domain-containing protein [Sphingomonas sp. A2-49]